LNTNMHEPNENRDRQTGMAPYMMGIPTLPPGYDGMMGIPGMTAEYGGLSHMVRRGWWLILLSTALAAGAAYFYLRTVPPTYTSVSRILVDKPNARFDQFPPVPGIGSTNYLQTQAAMITSREIVTAALNDPNTVVLPGDRLREVARTLSATIGRNTDIITVAASSAYPKDAATAVNAVVRAYIRWHEVNKQLSTAEWLKYLNTQLDARYKELDVKHNRRRILEQRRDSVPTTTTETLKMLEQELTATRKKILQLDFYYQGLLQLEKEPEAFWQYVRFQESAASTPLEDGERKRLTDELYSARRQFEESSAAGAVVQLSRRTQLQNKIAELEKRLIEFDQVSVPKRIAQAKSFLDKAREEEKKIKEMYDRDSPKVQDTSGQDSEYAMVVSECEMLEKFCNNLMSQIQAISPDAHFEGLLIRVIEPALPAVKPSSPQPVKIMGMGLVLGLVVGTGLAFLRDRRDQRVRSADEITAILGVPVLGVVPSMSKRGLVARGARVRYAPNSYESEAYRIIRTALFFGVSPSGGRTILITSPGPQEGKTTLVSNLGIAMAHAGQKTLIIDGDLRKPMQYRVFAMNRNGQGLPDVVTGTVTVDEAIRSTDIEGLDVLGGGNSIANPSEVLNSPAFAQILEQLKERYDRILVDSPPIGVVTDAQILAALCDLTLLVLRADRSLRPATQRAREALLVVEARVAGAVVNGVSRRDSKYGHYGAYSHYYSRYGSPGAKVVRAELPTNVPPPVANGASDREIGGSGP
jgi:succinoglycan biosynthesis transport protein ExoP